MAISSSYSEADMEVFPVIWGSCYAEVTVPGTEKLQKMYKDKVTKWQSW